MLTFGNNTTADSATIFIKTGRTHTEQDIFFKHEVRYMPLHYVSNRRQRTQCLATLSSTPLQLFKSGQ